MTSVSHKDARQLDILLIADSDTIESALNNTCPDLSLSRVENSEELIGALQRVGWDAVLSQLTLPGLSAGAALEILQQQNPEIPLIVIAESISAQQAVDLMQAGVQDCLSTDELARLPPVLEREISAARQRRQLAEHERVLGSIASRLPGYIFQRVQSADGTFRFTYLSESLREQFGVDTGDLMTDPANFWALIHPEDRESLIQVFAEAQTKLQPYHTEYRAILPDDRVTWVRVQAQPTCFENGDIVWDGVGIDVTAEKSAQEKLNYLAYFDSVTDLPNRHLFLDRLGQAIKQTGRTSKGLVLHMIDLDNFKEVNDTFGHAAGDRLLNQVARCLSGLVRESDTLARLGGDEFTLIQNGVMNSSAARQLAHKLVERLQQTFNIEGEDIRIGASIGIACYGPMFADSKSLNNQTELVKRADIALYDAKSQGRCTYRVYSEKLQIF